MLKAVISTRFAAFFATLISKTKLNGNKKSGSGKKILFGLLGVYLVICVEFLFWGMFSSLSATFLPLGLDSIYFAFIALLTVAVGFITNVFAVRSQIYDASDNELLLSLPIPPSVILAGRMIMLLILEYVYSALVLIPGYAVYFLKTSLSAAKLVFAVAGFVLLPLITMTLSLLFGFLLALLTSKIKRKSLFQTVFALLFIGIYIYFYSNMSNLMGTILLYAQNIGVAMKTYVPPLAAFGGAVGNGSFTDLIMLAGWCILPFAAVYFILTKTFIFLATAKTGDVKKAYKAKSVKPQSVRVAIIKKELARFFSVSTYIVNSGFGAVIAVIAAVMFILRKGELTAAFDSMFGANGKVLAVAFPVVVLALAGATVSASSVSLSIEGKNFWIIKTAPIAVSDIIFAKVAANFIIGVLPLFGSAVALWIGLGFSFVDGILTVIVPLVSLVFASLFGLVANLLFPKPEYTNITALVKQSGSAMLGIFGGIGSAIIPAVIVFFGAGIGSAAVLGCVILYYVILSVACYLFLRFKGKEKFEQI